jgi:hypothetical protein
MPMYDPAEPRFTIGFVALPPVEQVSPSTWEAVAKADVNTNRDINMVTMWSLKKCSEILIGISIQLQVY